MLKRAALITVDAGNATVPRPPAKNRSRAKHRARVKRDDEAERLRELNAERVRRFRERQKAAWLATEEVTECVN